jgi:hypothetical protein
MGRLFCTENIYRLVRPTLLGLAASAAEVRKEPEKKREDGAEEQAGNDGKIEGGMFAAVDDVARKFSKAKGEFAAEVKDSADERKQSAKEEDSSAEFAERVHDLDST